MKVDPNAPAYPFMEQSADGRAFSAAHYGIPIRLAIAAQILAAQASNGWSPFAADNRQGGDPAFRADRALEWADALIEAHNRGQA